MNTITPPSFGAPVPERGKPYSLPATPAFLIPEMERRQAGMSLDEKSAEELGRDISRQASWSTAGYALFKLDAGFAQLDKIVGAMHPEIADKTWSLKLGKEGFVVDGDDLTDDQRGFIANLANALPDMLDAAKSIQDAAVNAYDSERGQGTRETYQTNGYLKNYALQYYKDVESQLSGKVDFRALVDTVERYVTHDGTQTTDSTTYWGKGTLEVLTAYLKPAAASMIP